MASGRVRTGWPLIPALTLAVLGGWLLSRHHGLWYDELYTAEVSPIPLGELARALVHGEGTIPYLRDAPPSYGAPYYAAAHLWMGLTGLAADEWGLRLLSLTAAVAAMAVFSVAVGRLAGPRVGLVAGLVAATNPFVVEYSAEARGYALALLATAVAALGLARWLDGRRPSLLIYGLGGAAAGLAHWFALLPVAAFALAGVVLRGRRALPLLAVTALAALPALGLVATAVANGVGRSGAEWIPRAGLSVPWHALRSWSGTAGVLLVVTVVAAGAGLLASRRPGDRTRLVAASWVGIPLAGVTVVGFVLPVFVDRYLLPSLLGLAALVALGLCRVPGRWGVTAVAAAVTLSASVTLADAGRGPKEDVRGAVAAVARQHLPGEPVVAAARWDALGVDHYVRRHHRALLDDLVLPPAPAPSVPSLWVVRRARGGVKGDGAKRTALDLELRSRGMDLDVQERFRGRYGGVLVQRWRAQVPAVQTAGFLARPAT